MIHDLNAFIRNTLIQAIITGIFIVAAVFAQTHHLLVEKNDGLSVFATWAVFDGLLTISAAAVTVRGFINLHGRPFTKSELAALRRYAQNLTGWRHNLNHGTLTVDFPTHDEYAETDRLSYLILRNSNREYARTERLYGTKKSDALWEKASALKDRLKADQERAAKNQSSSSGSRM